MLRQATPWSSFAGGDEAWTWVSSQTCSDINSNKVLCFTLLLYLDASVFEHCWTALTLAIDRYEVNWADWSKPIQLDCLSSIDRVRFYKEIYINTRIRLSFGSLFFRLVELRLPKTLRRRRPNHKIRVAVGIHSRWLSSSLLLDAFHQ